MYMQKVAGLALLVLMNTVCVEAFCGFYVAKADAKLFNESSKVVLARDGNRTVLTMANDYHGSPKDFAIVVPVPVFLHREQIQIGDREMIQRLDAFSSPRLVEYFDQDPCSPEVDMEALRSLGYVGRNDEGRATSLGIKIEAQYAVGEYDILILSAKESAGLAEWLIQSGYKLPAGANELLHPYIKQNMKFFVAKVNLKEFEESGLQFLRPLQIAFESRKFLLPIRLGMLNADHEQDLIVYVLSSNGRAEVANYRTVAIPSDAEIPEFVEHNFGNFYKAVFLRAHEDSGKNTVFLEYAWDMSWCDPCAAEPLTSQELRKAGVFWLKGKGVPNVYLTRLHVRYSRSRFPEDLMFQLTGNRENFQARYILTHPYDGRIGCEAGPEYLEKVKRRNERQARTLARVTGWDLNAIRQKIGIGNSAAVDVEKNWWRKIFE